MSLCISESAGCGCYVIMGCGGSSSSSTPTWSTPPYPSWTAPCYEIQVTSLSALWAATV